MYLSFPTFISNYFREETMLVGACCGDFIFFFKLHTRNTRNKILVYQSEYNAIQKKERTRQNQITWACLL